MWTVLDCSIFEIIRVFSKWLTFSWDVLQIDGPFYVDFSKGCVLLRMIFQSCGISLTQPFSTLNVALVGPYPPRMMTSPSLSFLDRAQGP